MFKVAGAVVEVLAFEIVNVEKGWHQEIQINGQVSSELTDWDEKGRALKGLLAIQLHSGNANTVEIKDLRLKVLGDEAVVPFDPAKLPANAKQIERPGTKNPRASVRRPRANRDVGISCYAGQSSRKYSVRIC